MSIRSDVTYFIIALIFSAVTLIVAFQTSSNVHNETRLELQLVLHGAKANLESCAQLPLSNNFRALCIDEARSLIHEIEKEQR